MAVDEDVGVESVFIQELEGLRKERRHVEVGIVVAFEP